MLTPEAILERLHRAGYVHVTVETNSFGQTVFEFSEGHQVKLRNWGAFERKLNRAGLHCGSCSIGRGGMMHRMNIEEIE